MSVTYSVTNVPLRVGGALVTESGTFQVTTDAEGRIRITNLSDQTEYSVIRASSYRDDLFTLVDHPGTLVQLGDGPKEVPDSDCIPCGKRKKP